MGGLCCCYDPEPGRALAALQRMIAHTQYRGTATTHAVGNLVLAMQQHRGEASLYHDARGTCVLYGHIANRDTLWQQESGDATDRTDARLLAQLWEQSGENTPRVLHGQFAFILYRTDTRTLYLGNSADATRPLFYHRDGNRLWVGSGARQVVAGSSIPENLDPEGFLRTLLFTQVPNPAVTPYRGVSRCPAGDLLAWHTPNGRLETVGSHWQPPSGTRQTGKSLEAWAEELQTRFSAAVAGCLPDWPSAMLLSGGIDSASIWCEIQNLKPAQAVQAISLIYPGQANDERDYIYDIHQHCNSSGTYLDGRDRVPDQHLEKEVSESDYWLWAGSTFQLDQILEAASRNRLGTVLTGFGADEWLYSHRGYLADLFWQGHPLQALRLALGYQGDRHPRYSSTQLRRFLGLVFRHPRNRLQQHLRPLSPPQWLAPHWQEAWQTWRQEYLRSQEGLSLAERQLDDLHKLRRSGVSSDLFEQRVAQACMDDRHPYLDDRIMSLGFEIPPQILDREIWKSLQRTAFRHLLPPSVTTRRQATVQDARRTAASLPTLATAAPANWRMVEFSLASEAGLRDWQNRQPRDHMNSQSEFMLCAEMFLRSRY